MVKVSPLETSGTSMPSAWMALPTSRQRWMVSRPTSKRSSWVVNSDRLWWLITPLNSTPGRLSASLAMETPCSALLTPPRPIWVSTSMRRPIVTP